MALVPKLKTCFNGDCSKISFFDTTLAYAGLNTEGWGSPNTATTDVENAYIDVTYNGTTTTYEVTDAITAVSTASGEFILTTIDSSGDGEYEIVYRVISSGGNTIEKNNYCIFSSCSVKCCVGKLWLTALKKDSTDCPCTKVKNGTELAMQAQGLLNGVQFAASTGDKETAKKYLKDLQKICKLVKCKCS